MMPLPCLSIYIHIPFCRSRCTYCDFNTYADHSAWIDRYVECLISEIKWYQKFLAKQFFVHTVYFGGGSPNLLSSYQFDKILESLSDFAFEKNAAENSTELNPERLMPDYFKELKRIGINRISFGMQSAIPDELQLLGRKHSFNHVKASVLNARNVGFININLDLIYGIPGQSMKTFRESMNHALDLEPEHLSLYALHLEPHTPLAKQISSGEIPDLNDDLAADMYEWAMEKLAESGFVQYEISNWFRSSGQSDFRCMHNLQYWRNLDYLGIGAGAHSFVLNRRWENVSAIPEYCGVWDGLNRSPDMNSPAVINDRLITESDEIQETIMMGLRLTDEGIMDEVFFQRFGITINDLYPMQIIRLQESGLLEWAGEDELRRLRLTQRGSMLGNQVFKEFIKESD